jgi:peptidoglycan/xylan/chitin deacetylase (PgdA/CDA1 family)
MEMNNVCLIRYDVECDWHQEMDGFFETVAKVHKEHAIPATFFITGKLMEAKPELIKSFYREVEGCDLFDIQDHSYSHIGLGYEKGKPVEVLEEDYKKSFALHKKVLGCRPSAISMCGTGEDGDRLRGFDQTEKAKQEFEMLAFLGVKAVNTFLCGCDESSHFMNYGALDYPDIMGFPSGFSDTEWLWKKEYDSAMTGFLQIIEERGRKKEHMPVILHDWLAWTYGADREFDHVKRIGEKARDVGFELLTVRQCYEKEELWRYGK